ncbi:hypothetical protein MTO96_043641, partial [Rhipicephalus appendiculatus]
MLARGTVSDPTRTSGCGVSCSLKFACIRSTRSPSASDGGLSGVMIGYRPHGVTPGAGDEQQDATMEIAQTLLHLGLSPAPEAAAQGALWIVALNK